MSNKNHKNYIQEKLKEKHTEAKIVRRIVFTVFVVLMLALTGIIGGGYFFIKNAIQPVNEEDTSIESVEIPIGSSTTMIGQILEDHGIIKSGKIFRYYVKFKNESGFQAGEYELSPSMKLDDIIGHLKQGRVQQDVVFQITIPEGRQLEQIAEILEKRIGVSKDEFMEKANDKSYLSSLIEKFPKVITEEILNEDIKYALEGYLFPATYPFYVANPTIEEIIEVMLQKTSEILEDDELRIAMANKEFTPHKLLTMASLIEAEATVQTDREMIASVFYNRIDVGMPLQTDPTVLYALGEHKERTLYEDLAVDSPYNTYRNQGLPPGPIANAGVSSIQAALEPADTEYYYFLATPEGEVLFNETLEGHNHDKNEHITNQDNS
ncbi:endolytic transglycosylase MltG [Sutcliffiella rhizosphaerae]|uniref:Endolytic murein transglycosylase n=1 Tax=Sutcliffiella rhizosphaerae TaxID=2880967 RepID=A0ABM8YHT0_9BACI|nr:endolytic transglycosylase MltG [Sutcliffiella rhizosphaerae]CAG9619424.1 Endolytic murein transglycosylase [Sutcliffiella rhizosphaerae]